MINTFYKTITTCKDITIVTCIFKKVLFEIQTLTKVRLFSLINSDVFNLYKHSVKITSSLS